jgi:hypothetical protein
LTDASSLIAVCGQPPGFHAHHARGGQRAAAHEELGVLLRVNVAGDHRHVERIAQSQAQRLGERGLARADGAAHADLERARDRRAHERNNLESSAA